MDFNLPQNLEYCQAYVEQFSSLLLYSHLPTAIVAILLGVFTYVKGRGSLLSKLFLGITTSFALWCVSDFMIWKGYYSGSLVMSFWAPIEIFSTSLFLLSFYFIYVFVNQKPLPAWVRWIFLGIISSVVVITPTIYNLSGYDIQECIAIENPYYARYFLTVKFALAVVSLVYIIYKFICLRTQRKEIAILGLGVLFFLIAFFATGYFADMTGDYRLEMYGLFGMMVFIGALAYLIVAYQAFNIKLLGAQALVLTLISFIGAQFFFIQNPTNIILNSVTLCFSIIFGYFLVKSVGREVKLREELEVANIGQANLLHIINHQIKGYMNKARIVFDALANDSDYGPMPEPAKPLLKEGFNSVTEGVMFVQNFLNASNVERGTYTYNMMPVDFDKIVLAMSEMQRGAAEAKGLSFEVKIEAGSYAFSGDKAQLDEAVKNLIDNSINYTPTGSINVQLTMNNGKILLTIRDTGVGLSDEVKPKLFTKGGRDKDSQRININSTGFGLAFVKGVAEAHKGRVWAESAGVGKGSTFYLELPVAQ